MKKVNINDFGFNLDAIQDPEQKKFMESILGMMAEVINKATEGMLTQKDVDTKFEQINDKLKGYDAEKFDQLVKDNNQLREMLKKSMDVIEKAREKGPGAVDALNRFSEKIGEMYESEKFRDFCDGHSRKSGAFGGFQASAHA